MGKMECEYEVDGYRDFVFYSYYGSLINNSNFYVEFQAFLRQYNMTAKNKVENVSPHTLRHTGCTRNAEHGMDIKVLQYLMGHSNSAITMEVYNHVNEERAREHMEILSIADK